MKKAELQTKKRISPWILGGLVLVFLTLLLILQNSDLWYQLEVESAGSTLLLYGLSSLNFIAFIIFGFIFVRSLLKLTRERRTLQLGAKIKTRLLIYFFAISILPIVAMASFSYLFMNRAIERWFTQIPENVVREALKVQNQAIADQNAKSKSAAKMLAETLQNENPDTAELRKILEAGNLTRIEIVSKDGRVLAESQRELNPTQNTELENTLRLLRQNSFDDARLFDGNGFDAAYADFPDGRKVVIVPDLPSSGNITQLVDNSLVEFDRLKEQNVNVRQIGLLTLGVLTFLLLFASSWMAFYVAKGLTIPIKALAEGAGEIARGNLEHRVEVLAEDELALLVFSFNQMSAELERNSAQLRERRKYIETILQSLSTGVISFDGNDRITTINKAAVEIFKLKDANPERLELKKLVSKENFSVLEKLVRRARRIGRASEQTVLQREDLDASAAQTDENLPVALSVAALPKIAEEEKSGVVLVIEDLSELIAAQRASAWKEVARRMAHEIKNPLTPIQLSAERIAKRFAVENSEAETNGNRTQLADENQSHRTENQNTQPEDQTTKVIKDGTETILREVSSLKAMVDEFSRFARLPEARLESGNLNEVIKQTVMLYQDRSDDAEIKLKLSDNLPQALFDEEQLKRVFVNLIDNALEAFGKDQSDKNITIKTFYDAARDLIIAEVSDNGMGINPANFQKLFQPYFSTKGRGTGLGLAIVQRIITEHGGKIRVNSNSPKGTKFTIELNPALES